MKYLLMSDIHFGIKTGETAHWFFEHTKNFLLKAINESDADYICILGDLFEHRKYVDISIFHKVINDFFGKITHKKIKIICGNHDVYYKTTNEVNLIEHLAQIYDNIEYIKSPTVFDNILFVPWINRTTREADDFMISTTSAKYCFGHFDIVGAEMSPNILSKRGYEKSFFKKFDLVFSGHYHLQSRNDNFIYIGNPIQTNYGDAGRPKGCIEFNSDLCEYSRIKNENELFMVTSYTELSELKDYSKFTDKYVKVIINVNSTNYKKHNHLKFLETLNEIAYHVDVMIIRENKIIENISDLNLIASTENRISSFCSENSYSDEVKNYLIDNFNKVKDKITEE